jgi:hypothetical protein
MYHHHTPEHHERYYLYLIISVTIGVVLCLIIITGRIIISKNHEDIEESSKDEPKFHKSNTGETTITKGFSGDNICDMEGGDIDLTTPMGMGSMSAKNEVIFHALSIMYKNIYMYGVVYVLLMMLFLSCELNFLPSLFFFSTLNLLLLSSTSYYECRSHRLTRTHHHFNLTSALYQRVHLHY